MANAATDRKISRIENIRESLSCLRTYKRRTVVWPATLFVGVYEFKATLYDISLSGVRLKLDLPLANGGDVRVRIKDCSKLDARVAWHAAGFLGLSFKEDSETIKDALGELAVGLD